MKEILIDKEIGSDWFTDGVTASFVKKELESAKKGDEIRLTVDSPGGSVWECVSIYNAIRDFCRSHENRVTTYIRGMAASAASVIALAAHDANPENKVIVEDNSVYMIHNCWDVVIGNRNDMRKSADAMENIDDVIQAAAYVRKTGKKHSEIKEMMDAETWLYGQAIVDAGFADEVIASSNDKSEPIEVLGSAQNRFRAMKKDAKAISASEFVKRLAACAILDGTGGEPEKNTPSVSGGEKEGCMKMTAEEFKRDNPEAYAEIVGEAAKSSVEKERKRVCRLLKMGRTAGCLDVAAGFIESGADANDDDVQDKFFERRLANQALASQNEDDKQIPQINTPKDFGEADERVMMAAFEKEIGVGD